MAAAARRLRARSIETEDLDMPQGFDPDRSATIDTTIRDLISR